MSGLDFMNEDRRLTRYVAEQQRGAVSGRQMLHMVVHALFGYTGISRFLLGKYITATVQLFVFVCCFLFWGVEAEISGVPATVLFPIVAFIWWSLDARMVWNENGGDPQLSGRGTYHGNL